MVGELLVYAIWYNYSVYKQARSRQYTPLQKIVNMSLDLFCSPDVSSLAHAHAH